MQKIRVLVVDDHPIFRQGVVDSIMLSSAMEVVGQAADGEEGLQMIRNLQPQVAVVDINLPKMNGQQLTRRVVDEGLSTRIVLMTAYDDDQQRLQALRSGAAGYCSKDIHPDELIDLIQNVAQEKISISFPKGGITAAGPQLEIDEALTTQSLSTREMEVLLCVTRGMSNKEIALKLGISQQTVKNHVTTIFRKLGVQDRTQAALFAYQRGWVRLRDQ